MITEIQLTEIRNYLLTKNLPIDLLVEVQDHFISQINDLQREENLDFEHAFQRTKNSWQSELKPYWDGGWDLTDRNNMVRNFERSVMKSGFRKSLKYSLIILVALLMSALLMNSSFFSYVLLLTVLTLIALPIINYVKFFRSFRLYAKYQNYVLTLYQSFAFINFSFAYFLSLSVIHFEKGAKAFQEVMSVHFNWQSLAIVVLYFVSFIVSFFALISQKNYLKQIEKVKPFLKYLKPSS